ncbi:MAG: hypothetical protein DI603_05650 [Roseateles depolymerans]|uniref:Uncharacterized protein n=1 Tax=Roseateles depolymerans TaxID=76731 RepID=A0A2W5FXS6_9BURK|nr:MAG: hypothetical protein DI603_05650 [Roseateles depolymerans]
MSLLRTRTDLITLALVALLHLLLLLWLEFNPGSRESTRPQASRLRLIPLRLPPPPQVAAQDPAHPPPRRAAVPAMGLAARPEAPAEPAALPGELAGPAGSGLATTPAAAAPGPGGSAPLDLRLPVSMARKTEPTMAEQVARDPRSHTPRLSFSEKFAIALGTIECIYEELRPDGSIYRAPGRMVAKATSIVPATGKAATGRGGDTVGVCEK